jgi:hypothetical protein
MMPVHEIEMFRANKTCTKTQMIKDGVMSRLRSSCDSIRMAIADEVDLLA